MENLTNDTPPKKGFWTPPVVPYFSTPRRCQCSVFPVQESTTEQTRSSFGGVQKFSGERVLWYVFLPHIRFAPPHIAAQPPKFALRFLMLVGRGISPDFSHQICQISPNIFTTHYCRHGKLSKTRFSRPCSDFVDYSRTFFDICDGFLFLGFPTTRPTPICLLQPQTAFQKCDFENADDFI